MKRFAIWLAAVLAFAQCALFAEFVGEETAATAAAGFLSNSSTAKRILDGRTVESVEVRSSIWLVHLAPSGYIEIAGSTKCAPVLSFSAENFTDPEAGSPLAAKLLADSEMCEAKEADSTAADNAQWKTLLSTATSSSTPVKRLLRAATPSATTSDPYVGPLLGASWYQDAPYNDLSPLNSLSGCMATAAGQEHRYWRWPYRYEKWRSTTHGLRNSLNEYSDHKFRLNGLVPFDYDKIWGSYSAPTKTTPTAADKEATYNAAFLSLWMQSLTGMGYKPGGSGGTIKLCTNAEDYWFEKGPVMNYWRDGYTNLWTAVTNDLANGSPIQVNSPGHQMVVDGYAVDDAGTENEVDWININYGWGSPGGWNNFQTAVLETTPGGRLADFQIGYRPQKIVQFEPVPKVCGSDVTLTWHIAPCYTNRMTGFTLDISGGTGSSSSVDIPTHDETTSYTATGLESGYEYTFTVTPVMADGSEARSNSATTTIGTPAAAPEISAVSSVAGGLELVQQGFYIECGRGIVNDIAVTCSESTTSLEAYPSHITVLPDEKVTVEKSGNVFTVHLDATDMDSQWNGEMLILTLVAKNSDGTEAYKNLMLRFNGMRQVLDGTFDVVETNPITPVWYCGTTTLDAKGQNITFGANAFQGNGCNVTLTDSVGGGSFTFAGLDGFLGTLHITSAVDVTLPDDMSGFRGTLAYDRCYSDNEFHYTLSRDLPATATIYLPQYTMLYLDNVTVDAAITGSGDVYIVTGNSTLNNTSGFSGTVAIGDFDNSGSLTLNAGEEPGVSIWNGTLYLTLSKAQVAYGYSTTQIKDLESYFGSKVIFLDEAGTELARWTSDQTTYSIASTANTWTPNELGTGSFWDASRWSQGLPSEGDYVIFKDTFGDTEMTLNLSSDFNLGYVQVLGTKFNIKSSGTGKLTVDTFENDVYTKISTDSLLPEVVIPKASLFVAAGITIDCEIDQSLAKNMRDISDTMYALDWEDCWHGTVVFKNYTAAELNPWEWGNSNSVVRLNGVTGYFAYNQDFYGPVELVDNGETVALHWNNGSGSSTNKFHKLTGTGTFKTSGNGGGGEKVLVKDVSEFTGSLQLASKTLALGPEMPSSNTGSNGKLHVCTNATIAAGAIWNIGGGVYLGGGCDLDIYGQLWSTSTAITTYADNAVVTLEDNAVLKVGHALAGSYAPTLNFKAGTYQIGTNVRETKTVNFCAAPGQGTTLDANGHKLTLGPAFFSGAGDVYLTSSASGGSVVIEGIPAAYTGTIYADISCPVTLSGPQRGGTLNISDIVVSTSSANIGTITVGSGATLSLAVSRDEESAGYTTSGITLVDGGELEFRSSSGTTLAVATESDAVNGNYTLEGDSEVSLDPLLRYEFNGNMVSTGTDHDATLRIYSGTASYYEGEQLYTKSVPYINKDFAMPDDDWTLTMRCVMPASNSEKATIAIMFGKSSGNQFGLVSGTAGNTVALATKTALIGEAVEVEDATSELHMYTIVKTSGNVKLYVDGILKVDSDTTVSGLTKRFQIGSVFQGNSSSHAACTDSTSRIDFMMFHDFAASASFVASLAAPYLPDPEELPEGAVASVVYNGEVVYHNTVMDALTAVYMGQSDTPVVKVYDGSTTDYSGLGFTYDAATQTYTMVTAVAKIQTGIIESEFATLAEACETAQEEGVSVVILLKAFAEIGESIPAGWVYVTPAESNTDYGTLALAVNEIPNTVCKMPLTQENVHLSADGEWAVVGAKPIYITLGSATNSFTLSFDADIPDGVYGTLLSWDSVLGTTNLDSRVVMTNDAAKQVIWRTENGTLSTAAYKTSELIPSGEHYIELSWVHNEGATIKVDGEPYYDSENLKFTDYLTSRLAFGGSALGSPNDVLAGLKVKNLNLRFGKTPTEPDEEEAGYPVLNYVTRLDGTVYHGNDDNRLVITNWQSQLIHPATRPVPAGKTDAEFDTIDVLFVYDTPGKASVEAGDTEEWNGFSKLEVFSAKATARMNQILCTTDMDTNFWFRMVGVHCVDGTGGTIAEILGKGEGLRDEYSGLLDLRDRYGADVIVTPTTQSGGYGGLARLNTLDEITSRHQNAAYHIASVLLGYSQTHAWVHEIGHNMSLNHYPPANFDPANTWRGLGIQHKIAVDGTPMSTVMAEQGYADFCGGFSSKNHIYHGSMLSISNHLDSTGVLLEAAPYVSEWRTTRIPETRSIKCLPDNASTLVGDTEFTLSYPDPDAEIYYQAWGLNDNEFVKYNGPFTIPATTGYAYITAYAVTNGVATAQELVNFSTFGDTYKDVLGSGSLPWSIVSSIDGNWAPSNEGYYEINDNFTGKSNSVCVLSTSLNGPGTLTFEHSELLKDNPYWHDTYPHSYPNSSFVVWVDNEPAYALRDATNTIGSWVSTDIAIPEGTHKVEFVYTHRSSYVSGETVRIKRVAFASAQEPECLATVVRVHPRLTRGLAREALLGIRFDNALGGNASAFDVHFRLENCTKADITDIKYWRQPYTHNYGFYEAEATQGPAATVSAADDATEFTASFPKGSVWFYPQVNGRKDSDYLWVTATINPEISPEAKIWVSVPTEKIRLSNGGVFKVVNGAETQPHRVFPFVHQIGAYLRQDTALAGTWAGKLEDSPADRVGNLTDIVVCNDFLVAYDSENDTFKTTWDARGRDNTAQVARIKALRDQYNQKCMIRASLTKGEGTITVDGVMGRPIACAAASAARRKQLIDSILAVMESAGLDGLDIDWEYPGDHNVTDANTQRDWHSYGLLMRDLAAAFFDKGYVLSFCSNLGYQMAPKGYYAAFHAADFVNAMAYGNTTLNASPQVMMNGIDVCRNRGVPPRRIVVGQAMYAYEVQNPGWSSVVGWLKEAWPSDNTRWWDADLVWKERSAQKSDNTVISTKKETFEGPSSYHAKCNWCRANGYGGVMSWGYFTDVSWDDDDLMSLARHQAKSCWPRENWSWPTPQQDDNDGAYLLDSEEDWFWLRDNPGVNARFAADITLAHDPLPIETFSGTIDGAGHTLTISNDVWLAYDSNPALVRTLTGTVKNLKIDLYGRVVSRASRWNDTTVDTDANTLDTSATHTAAVLAANLGAGGVIDGVELDIQSGAEVQGPQRVAGLAASVWVPDGSHAEIRNCRVHVAGMLRSLARNTAEYDITVTNQVAGGLAGWVACPGSQNIVVTNNIVSLASTGRVAVETGNSSSAGGVIGDLNNAKPLVQSNAVYVASGTTVSANESAAAGKVRTSHAVASYSIASSGNAHKTMRYMESGAATLDGSVGGYFASAGSVVVSSGADAAAGAVAIAPNLASSVVIPADVETPRIFIDGVDVTGAFATPEKGVATTLVLDPEGSVGDVPVRPELAEQNGFAVESVDGEDVAEAVFTVKTIPGLWYSVVYGDALVQGGIGGEIGETAGVKATGTTLTLEAPEEGAVRFYQIRVAPTQKQ